MDDVGSAGDERRIVVRLVLRNVSYKAGPHDIARFCAAVGTLLDVSLPVHKDTRLRKEFVFVTLRLYPGRARDGWRELDQQFMQEPGNGETLRMIEVGEATRERKGFRADDDEQR